MPDAGGRTGERPDVTAFELLTRALIGIALEGLQAAGEQVSLPQFRLLLTLGALGRVPSSKLAAQLGLAASAITRMVDRLQDAGLVQRGTDPRSRRIVTVDLTADGHRLVTAVLSHRRERLAAVLDRMSAADHAAAVRAARQFSSLSGDAIAFGESGPVPLLARCTRCAGKAAVRVSSAFSGAAHDDVGRGGHDATSRALAAASG